ncbi:uncharacterized protein [Haliotis cracherodii]|uniref:uncharacterized protein n=1 Tax=Haliotis cracherodii TaxID=6455 RepID=UPI0039E7857F
MKGVLLVLCVLGLLGSALSQCDEHLATPLVARCLDMMTTWARAKTARQLQRGCSGAYAYVACMEMYILECREQFSSPAKTIELLEKMRGQRLKIDTFCHRRLASCKR